MPLLRKQPFQKQNPPFGLKLDDEGFYSKITNEIFTDYESDYTFGTVLFTFANICRFLHMWFCA